MKNSLNNVDRGMNIAVFNGRNGKSLQQRVFDLFEKGSANKKFSLKDLILILLNIKCSSLTSYKKASISAPTWTGLWGR